MDSLERRIHALCESLQAICLDARRLEEDFAAELAAVHPQMRDSARNLLHYMALRNADIRGTQHELTALGLSSLGRAERHTMASISTVLKNLQRAWLGASVDLESERREFDRSTALLERHTRDLLGDARRQRDVRIMVTLPSEVASREATLDAMLTAGMDLARINCAHDRPDDWLGMIDAVRLASRRCDRPCRIMMDLGGPKVRTGVLKSGPRVVRLRPRRDALGRVIAPRRLTLVRDNGIPCARPGTLPVTGACAELAQPGDELRLRDTRGKKRRLKIVEAGDGRVVAELFRTAYIATGTKLTLKRRGPDEKLRFRVGQLPAIEEPILLRQGDMLRLHAAPEPGRPARIGADGRIKRVAHVACTPPQVLDGLHAGDAVRLDDGKIEGRVVRIDDGEAFVQITRAKPSGTRLRGGKGLNFPGTDVLLNGLTDADRDALPFVAEHADAVGLSFVRDVDDVEALQAQLAALPGPAPGILLKIETERAFCNLPRLLLAGMRSYPLGIVIARGDLAVECGWERLAEIQEEILWLCEAAHVPVVWATQVLESETKKGMPSRAEITDAAMSQRADCVMLNKGPYIVEAIAMLADILCRMQDHQSKKTAMLRRLRVSDARAA